MFGVLEDLTLLQDALTMAAAFALVGGLVASRHERRGGRQRPSWMAARWAVAVAVVGIAIHAVVEVA